MLKLLFAGPMFILFPYCNGTQMAAVYTNTAQQECAWLSLISCKSVLELGQRKEPIFSNYFKTEAFIFITAGQKQYNVSEPFSTQGLCFAGRASLCRRDAGAASLLRHKFGWDTGQQQRVFCIRSATVPLLQTFIKTVNIYLFWHSITSACI